MNLLKGLSNHGGDDKLNKFMLSLKKKNSIVKYITVFSITLFILFYLCDKRKQYMPLQCLSFYLVLITILNLISRYLYIFSLEKMIFLFKAFCVNVVKFEDFSKCIIKIQTANSKNFEISKNHESLFFDEILRKLTTMLNQNKNQKLNFKENSKISWEDYLKNKYEFFEFLFSFFEQNYQNREYYFIFFLFFHSINTFSFLHKLEKLTLLISTSLSGLKNKIESSSQVDEKIVIDKILRNINLTTFENKTNLNFTTSTVIFMDQISDLIISNSRINNDYFTLFNLLHNYNHGNSNNTCSKEQILEKLEILIESKYNTINILKQIKSNFLNQSNLILNNIQNIDDLDEEVGNDNNKVLKQGVSLFDIELSEIPKQIQEKKEKQVFANVSHFEIMRGAENTRQLQMNLIYDLEEFQNYRNKEEENPRVDENLKDPDDCNKSISKNYN